LHNIPQIILIENQCWKWHCMDIAVPKSENSLCW
jgi:hypothetical protein